MKTHNDQRDPRASVSVIVLTTNGSLLLQIRDDRHDIEYPGHWSLIGGWIEPGETPRHAIYRELAEELESMDGGELHFGRILYLGCDQRPDRPWAEYVFGVMLFNDTNRLRIREGKGLGLCSHSNYQSRPIAPHHRRYLDKYIDVLNDTISQCSNEPAFSLSLRKKTKMSINDYCEITQLGLVKDYPALEGGNGYVVADTTYPTAGIHPLDAPKFIALLEFKHATPRGNHYHMRKVEYMTVLRGQLQCEFHLVDDPDQRTAFMLEVGQTVRIMPGCVHTFTAVNGDVYAMEYAPQAYEASDVIVL